MSLPRRITRERSPLMEAMRTAIKSGLEIWQVSTACRPQALPVRQRYGWQGNSESSPFTKAMRTTIKTGAGIRRVGAPCGAC